MFRELTIYVRLGNAPTTLSRQGNVRKHGGQQLPHTNLVCVRHSKRGILTTQVDSKGSGAGHITEGMALRHHQFKQTWIPFRQQEQNNLMDPSRAGIESDEESGSCW